MRREAAQSFSIRSVGGWMTLPLRRLGLFVLLAACPAYTQTLDVTPDDQTIFNFSGFQGGPFLPETVPTWTLDNSDLQEALFTVSTNQLWLTVTPTNGSVGGALNRDIDISALLITTEAESLSPGLYTATVSFTNLTNGAGNTQRTVQLRVAPANFSVAPAFINATAFLNGANPADILVTLTGNGRTDLNYDLDWSTQPWLSLSKTGGTVPAGGSDVFLVLFNITGLEAKTYTSEIEVTNVTNGAGTRTIPVSLTVKPTGAGSVTLRPDQDIEVIGPVGALPYVTQRSTITNEGDQPVTWNAIASSPWVSVSPSAGDLAAGDGVAGGADERAVDIRVNAAVQTVPPGSSAATVTFQTTTTNLLNGTVTGLAFGTRVVHAVANPVLTMSMPAVGGEVTTSPSGAAVGAATATSQRLSFPFGQVVVVTAAPGDGYEFRSWAGDFPKDAEFVNPLILPMDASKSLGALIAPILRTLTVSALGAGSGTITMTPTGVDIENALNARYTNGTTVKLTADPDAGSVFRGWTGNVPPGEELSNPLTVLMDRERVIAARFEPALSFEINVTGNGSVTVDPDLPAYSAGMAVVLTAEPDEGHSFAGWSGDASGSETTLTITLGGDTVIEAAFVAGGDPGDGDPGDGDPGDDTIAKLFVDIQGDGIVTPNGGNYVKGATVTLIATPGLNSRFVQWEQDALGTELTATVLMDRNKTVRALFELVDQDSPGQPVGAPAAPACGAMGILGLASILLSWTALTGLARRR